MTQPDIERLKLLHTLLGEIRDTPRPDTHFNLGTWYDSTVDFLIDYVDGGGELGGIDHSCGTVACAIGHACLDPRFNALGLKMCLYGYPETEGATGWVAVDEFFGLQGSEAHHLFDPDFYPNEINTTLAEVIDRLHNFITTKESEQ